MESVPRSGLREALVEEQRAGGEMATGTEKMEAEAAGWRDEWRGEGWTEGQCPSAVRPFGRHVLCTGGEAGPTIIRTLGSPY